MLPDKIWDFWSPRYESLLVQKLALSPIRSAALVEIRKYLEKRSGKEGAQILDMGCGTGQLVLEMEKDLKQFVPEITGVDMSPGMIDQALLKDSESVFICSGVDDYAPGENSFHVIVCLNSFPYYRDQEKVLDGFRKILKPGGLLILAHSSINTIYDRLIMAGVKLTVSGSRYPSILEMNLLSKKIFGVEPELTRIETKWFMPTLCMFIWRSK